MKILLLTALLIQANISFGENKLDFLKDTKSGKKIIVSKIFQGEKNWSYFDKQGRDAHFRGWNISGSVNLISMGFRPF